ncbi:MAG TPA: isoaspartyl peptidase/L-asparaginase [Polyangiaceae bacterium]
MVLTSWGRRDVPSAAGWSILVHGGAGRIDAKKGHIEGCRDAASEGARVLAAGGSSLDAVQAAVRVLEDNPLFNAGTGACLDEDGGVELDAAIMDGASLRAGAVCALPPFRHPIDIARAVLEDGRHVLYAADGAARFATNAGFEALGAEAMITDRARTDWREWKRTHGASSPPVETVDGDGPASGSAPGVGTVGAVARDVRAIVAAATSTGGILGKRRGRVGDSPIVGAGTFADEAGAASATGQGEGILRTTLGRVAVDAMRAGRPPEGAAYDAIERLVSRVAGEGGIILVDQSGRLGWARSTPAMSWAAAWDGLHAPEGGI